MTASPVPSAKRPSTAALRRWLPASICSALILIYLIFHRVPTLDEHSGTAVNDIVWWFAALGAMLACLRTAQHVDAQERAAWRVLGSACALWWIGQSVWTFYELVLGGLPAFPHWMQIPFSAYDWVFVIGLLLIPKPAGASRFTPRHGGNLVLIVCSLIVAFIVAFYEPALSPKQNERSSVVVLLHSLGLASMFVVALFLLWSYPWRKLYTPLVFIVLGTGAHTATYVAYAHEMMARTYLANEWFNASWIFVFGAYACAAYDRLWNMERPEVATRSSDMERERWLEALIPAFLIVLMLSVAWFYSDWLSPRAATWASLAALVFSAALGLREMWIQREEQRLMKALNETNDSMTQANRELSQSEARYRTLSAELEQRVKDRTVELQQAYRELENFSYAVAHDLKAPLRSVDGFGAILFEEYGGRLDDKGKAYLQRMRRSALKMSELIDDLLAYSRVERRDFRLTNVSLPGLIDKVVAEQRDDLERHGVEFSANLPQLAAQVDEEGLFVVCRNLLQNAIKFSQHAKPPRIDLALIPVNAGVRIEVRDNGVGFDMEHHDKIFEMFQRLHRADEIPGTGIGLAIVRKAIERMNGRVWATSAVGQGATFCVEVPAPPQ